MKIALDAMGGDFGPKVTMAGALKAIEALDVNIILVGKEGIIKREINKLTTALERVEIVDAPEAIGMAEGLVSFRNKKNSSIAVGARLVHDGLADAFVSMGNTAAVVYISRQILGPLPGIDRPALALLVPNMKEGFTLLIDVGANANCQPHNLFQFAIMGKVFMQTVCGIPEPKIALMSIGEERGKGNLLVKETFERLQQSPLNFFGNIEGREIYKGIADVIVSDGFTGNVALKVTEGVVEIVVSMARNEITRNIFAKLGYFLMRRHLKKIYKKVDYSEYGGAQLLGVNGVCIIGHGRSNSNAVYSAIRRGRDFVLNNVQERIQEEIRKYELCLKGAGV